MSLKSKIIRGSFLLIVLELFLYGCAQVIPLSGGARDTKAPDLISVTPADRSTNIPVDKVKIVFKFDELVAAQNISQKLIINPLTAELPEVTASGKTLTVVFEKALELNTTYLLQFGNSVVDIHESNPYPNLSYMFSTGPVIDTAFITGKVVDALSQKPAADVSVMLYKNLSDSTPLTTGPDYITRSDEKGNYFLSAIKPGTYKVLALADKNRNRLYDLPESVGFPGGPVQISNDTLNLRLSAGETDRLFIKKKIQAFWGYHKYVLNDTFPDAYIITEKSIDTDKYLYEMRNDTLEVSYKELYARNFDLVLKNGTKAYDTIQLEIPPRVKVDSSLEKGLQKLTMRTERGTYHIKHDEVIFHFNVPVKKVMTDKCILLRDTVKEMPLFTPENLNENGALVTTFLPTYARRLLNQLLPQRTYALLLLPGAVETFWGTFNRDTLRTTFKTAGADEYGNLKVKLSLPDSMKHYVLQLLQDKGNVLKESAGTNKSDLFELFYNLPAGDYLLRLVDDTDQNQKFSPGRYFTNTQPEPVYLYDKPVKIPAGWDVETDWKIILPAKK